MKGPECRAAREEGQSIVILAMAMVGLLVFAGLAVDAGVVYVTSVRLARAVDAAALAGVVELPYESSVASTFNADTRAKQFLAANEIWPTAEITGTEFFDSSRQSGVLGTYRYAITATHQANLYFLPLVNFDHVRLRDSAAAEYNPMVSIYASQTGNYGIEQTVNLTVYGPDICSRFGDPYTPSRSPWWDELEGVYHFRLDIPANYEGVAQDLTRRWNGGTETNDIVRIEIWDPDCYNNPFSANQFVITDTITDTLVTISNACGSNDRRYPCTPATGDVQNPFGFVRIDENDQGNPGDDSTCTVAPSYSAALNTTTRYTLYYYRKRGDGSLERRDLARYTKGGANSDSDTDMLWVSPGGSRLDDPLPDGWVGSAYGFTWDEGDGNFEVDINPDSSTFETTDIYIDPADGSRTLFLDIQAISGASENGFDLWAGPLYKTTPSDVNARNVDIVLQAGDYHSGAGATWSGIGHLPMNNNTKDAVAELTLTYVPANYAGRTMVIESFDNDAPDLVDRIDFYFDTLPWEDWYPVSMEPAGNGDWTIVSFTVPSAPTHTFYGGYLMAEYEANEPYDTFTWKITSEGVPKLVE